MEKIEVKLTKKRAKDRIEVAVDKDYDDLLLWRYIVQKDNKLRKEHMIIRKDLENWITYHQHHGWTIA